MIKRKTINIIFIILLIFQSFAYSQNDQTNRIEVLVNENIITKYDIVQRIKINSILKRIEVNENNYNQIVKVVVDDLVIEKLKIKKINKYNISIAKDEFKKNEKIFYSNLGYTKSELEELFDINNINFNNLIELIEIEMKWQKLIYGLYLRVTSVTEQEVNDLISKNPDIDEETANELVLQKQLDIKSAKLIKDLKDEATIEYR
tara:strand:- start:174 stop:785 length:612 start_codon:yes stop_codon:yes gene_type:complete